MIDWSAIRPVLVSTITSIATSQLPSPTPSWRAEWSDRHRDFISPEQELALYLKVTTVVTIGEDEDRYSREDDGEVYVTQTGLRRFVLNLQAEVSEDEDAKSAQQTIERIRTRLRRKSVLEALEDVGVALVEVGTSQNLSAAFDKRVWSIANLDVTFSCAVNDTDPVPVGWIERVVLSPQVGGVSPNPNAQEIPPQE